MRQATQFQQELDVVISQIDRHETIEFKALMERRELRPEINDSHRQAYEHLVNRLAIYPYDGPRWLSLDWSKPPKAADLFRLISDMERRLARKLKRVEDHAEIKGMMDDMGDEFTVLAKIIQVVSPDVV